mmetsp:Transcript_43250/g.115912  ORF Transcript_43250/g.115912 Transcript_43250/m.115912 type:complete len:217 (+) Transcript_43250:550-1200(+)
MAVRTTSRNFYRAQRPHSRPAAWRRRGTSWTASAGTPRCWAPGGSRTSWPSRTGRSGRSRRWRTASSRRCRVAASSSATRAGRRATTGRARTACSRACGPWTCWWLAGSRRAAGAAPTWPSGTASATSRASTSLTPRRSARRTWRRYATACSRHRPDARPPGRSRSCRSGPCCGPWRRSPCASRACWRSLVPVPLDRQEGGTPRTSRMPLPTAGSR